jgi:PAS domain S-box-containing protein
MLSDEMLRAAWSGGADAMAVADAAGVVRAVNPAFERLLACDAARLVGRRIDDLPIPVGVSRSMREAGTEQGEAVHVLTLRSAPESFDRRIFDSLDSGVLWYDAQLRIVEANRAARAALGLGEGTILSLIDDLGWRQFDRRLEPLPNERRPVWRAQQGGEGRASDVVVIETPARGRRWVRVNALAVAVLGPVPGPGVFVSLTDFTDEREAMRTLRDNERLFRLFGEHAVDVLWIVDPRARKLVYVNAAYERIWGRPAAALFEDLAHWLDGVDPADLDRVAGAAQAMTSTGTYEVEYRMRRPDGQARWIRGRGFPLYGEDGRMRYMAGFAEDITLAREAEQLQDAHRVAQERLERIVATAPGAVHSLRQHADGSRAFTFASPAIRELLGVEAQVLVEQGIDLLSLVHPEDRGPLALGLRESAANGTRWLGAFRVPDTPAGERWIEAHAMPVREEDGGTAWHGFFVDVTERRRVEQQLQLLNRELERRVAERTAELEAKHRQIESFAYSVSHDLKAPLRGIEGYSRLLESDHAERLDEEGRFFVEMIRKATIQMGQLIDDLLAYSRIERGRPALAPIAPASLVDALLAGVAAELGADGVRVTVAVDPGLVVHAEREGLMLALRNLLENALKFTGGRAERAIEIGARREGTLGLLWVRDNGPGFDMRYHDRIFEIFQRLHRSEDYPGTGVGLAMVRKAVERMQGRVWAEARPGVGAVFTIELPIAQAPPSGPP